MISLLFSCIPNFITSSGSAMQNTALLSITERNLKNRYKGRERPINWKYQKRNRKLLFMIEA